MFFVFFELVSQDDEINIPAQNQHARNLPLSRRRDRNLVPRPSLNNANNPSNPNSDEEEHPQPPIIPGNLSRFSGPSAQHPSSRARAAVNKSRASFSNRFVKKKSRNDRSRSPPKLKVKKKARHPFEGSSTSEISEEENKEGESSLTDQLDDSSTTDSGSGSSTTEDEDARVTLGELRQRYKHLHQRQKTLIKKKNDILNNGINDVKVNENANSKWIGRYLQHRGKAKDHNSNPNKPVNNPNNLEHASHRKSTNPSRHVEPRPDNNAEQRSSVADAESEPVTTIVCVACTVENSLKRLRCWVCDTPLPLLNQLSKPPATNLSLSLSRPTANSPNNFNNNNKPGASSHKSSHSRRIKRRIILDESDSDSDPPAHSLSLSQSLLLSRSPKSDDISRISRGQSSHIIKPNSAPNDAGISNSSCDPNNNPNNPMVKGKKVKKDVSVAPVAGAQLQRSQRSSECLETQGQCVVCLSIASDMILIPCFHLCLCQECSNDFKPG